MQTQRQKGGPGAPHTGRSASESLPARATAFIERHALLHGVRRLGIAVSGGSDSTALLRLLLPLGRAAGVEPVVLHFDHGLRGADSAADARAVARLAGRLGVRCRVSSVQCSVFSVQARRSDHRLPTSDLRPPASGLSLEMTARTARLAFFGEIAKAEHLDAIATGHTADDVAETLLLRLARGSGAGGLAGLRPRHTVAGVTFVRPLLDVTHAQLRTWLRRHGWTWREDATNRDRRIPRNLVRHAVLPWLERHWTPSLRAMLVQSAAILRDEDALLEEWAARRLRRVADGARSAKSVRRTPGALSATRLKELPVALQRRVVRKWLLDAGCTEAAGWAPVERLLAGMAARASWQVSLPGGVRVRGHAGNLEIMRADFYTLPCVKVTAAAAGSRQSGGNGRTLPVPGSVVMAGVRVTARQGRGIVRTAGPVGALPSACSLDAAAVHEHTLIVRTRRPGDRIRPLGLNGSKSIQDLFVDAKVPARMRDRLPLLVVDGDVVWVPGYRVAHAFAVRGPAAPSVRVRMGAARLEERSALR